MSNPISILVNADFLVNSRSNPKKLFSLIKTDRELKVTVISECLERACNSKGIEFKSFVNTLLNYRIKVISRYDLKEDEIERLLANLENAKQYISGFDYQLEVAYAITLGVFRILTDNQTTFLKADISTSLKILSIDELKRLLALSLLENTDKYSFIKTPIFNQISVQSIYFWKKNKEKRLMFVQLIIIAFISVLIFPTILKIVPSKDYCYLDNNLFLSCGEKILIEEENTSEAFREYTKTAFQSFQNSEYENAVKYLKLAFKENRSPEILIYLNNSLLEAKQKTANTIAITVPISQNKQTAIDDKRDLAKEILRGVAHAQTLVNYCFFSTGDTNDFEFLQASLNSLKENNKLCDKIRRRGKGLRIILVDDVNNPGQAVILADELNRLKNESILAVMGHYASDLTSEVIKKYSDNKLVLISFGSTSENKEKGFLDDDDYFFRTVPGVTYHVDKLVEYIKKKGYKNPAIFYNESSDFSKSVYNKFIEKFENEIGNINPELVFKGDKEENKSFAGKDFNSENEVNKAKDKDADVLILFPDGQTSQSMYNAIEIMKANQGSKPIIGTWTLRNNRFLEAAKDNPDWVTNENLVVYSPYFFDNSNLDNNDNKQYVEQGNALWGDASSPRTALSYDAAWVLINAFLKTNNLNRQTLQETLNNMGTVEGGATGDITFDDNGNRNNLPGLLLEVEADTSTQETGLKFVPLSENVSP